jgi:hypothetical protein
MLAFRVQIASLLLLTSFATAQTKHEFWDKTNKALLASAVAAGTFDYVTTQRNRIANEKVGSTFTEHNVLYSPFAGSYKTGWVPGAINVGGSTLGNYLLHRTGHHRLERLPLMFSIYSSTACGIGNLRPFNATRVYCPSF